jgi:predicted permease
MISHGWRSWRASKGPALLAIVALAAGIGCATAIFTIVHPVLLKPLPYSHPDRWVAFFGGSTLAAEANQISGLSIADLTDYQQRCHSLDVFGWYSISGDFNLTSPGQPEHIQGVEVTPSLVDNVGVSPLLGNLFHDSDGTQVALISSRLWKRLGADPAIVGKSVTLNGQMYTVTGVMPASFQLPIVSVANEDVHNDVWIPANPPKEVTTRRNFAEYAGYARLKPGVSLTQARADAKDVAAEIVKENAGRDASYTVTLFGLQDFVSKEIRPVLLLFLAAAGLLLLVACANVAGLLVARSISRAQEISIRVALGARKSHLALQFFFEGCFISIAAATLGVLASVGLTHLVLSLASEYIPRSGEISTNGIVVLFAAGLCCITATLPALAPLWQAVRTQPNEVLSSGIRASAGAKSRRLSQSLVTAEIALAFLLLSVGGLLIAELENLQHTWPGFDTAHLLTFQLNDSSSSFSSTKEFLAFQNKLLTSLEAVPGVASAALSNQLPLNGCCLITTLFPEGQPAAPGSSEQVSFVVVSAGYFNTLRIPLQKGRLLTEHDDQEDPVSIVVDDAAAKHYWPDRDPVGEYLRAGSPNGQRLQVVGVVGNVRNEGLGAATRPEVYFLNAVSPVNPIKFIVRSNLPASTLVPSIRESMLRVAPGSPIYALQTMNEIVKGSVFLERFDSLVVALFAIAALLMASLGVYSVTSYWVRERTVEIGTRMALGAVRGDLLRLVVGGASRMTGYGMLIGILGAIVATSLVARFLSLHHIGIVPYIWSVGVVAGVATAASFFPAWRATLLSPMVAIRNESDSLWSAGRRRLEHITHRDTAQESASPSVSALLTGFIDASRRADSFAEALGISLSDLREKIQAESAMLFEASNGRGLNNPGSQFQCRAASPPNRNIVPIPLDGLLARRLKFYNSPLAFAADDMDTALRWALEQNSGYLQEIEQLKQMRIRLVAQLRMKNETIGLLLLGAPLGREAYSHGDKLLVQACAQELALMMENAHLTDRVLEQEKVRRDVALAAEVQERLLPQKSIEAGSSSVAAFMLPARGIGGDCFDFLELANGHIGIALADVAGKGVPAALIMAVIQASLRVIASEKQISPPELTAKMNHFLFQQTGSSSYATFFYAQLDSQLGKLRYVNAGHNPPYLVRARDGKVTYRPVEELTTGGAIIGMFPVNEYEEGVVSLHSGDVVFAFTDGVPEAHNPDQDEFGEERLKDLVCRVAHLSVQQIVTSVSQELRNWIADAPQYDDLTFIVLKIS